MVGVFMKKILLSAVLFIPSLSFSAQWEIYATANNGNQVSTFDRDSIKEINPNIYKVWTNTTDIERSENTKINNYIDCKKQTINHADIYIYKEKDLIDSATNNKGLMSPPPDSVGWSLIQAICVRK